MQEPVYIVALDPDSNDVFGCFKMEQEKSLFLCTAGLVEYYTIPKEMFDVIDNIDLTKKRLKFVDGTVYECDM
jgi:hypothetical protein